MIQTLTQHLIEGSALNETQVCDAVQALTDEAVVVKLREALVEALSLPSNPLAV